MSQPHSTDTLTGDEIAAVIDLAEVAHSADGVAPLGEQTLLEIRHGTTRSGRFLLARDRTDAAEPLVGFAYRQRVAGESDTGELVVSPEHRRRGHGSALLSALIAESSDRGLRVWAHGRLPGAVALADSTGLTQVRGLWKMRLSLRDADTSQWPRRPLGGDLGERLDMRTFRLGADEAALLETNRRAFADHPEQGALTLEDLRRREAEEWFDPEGLFLAVDRETGRIAGFHWTKVHADGAGLSETEPVGEVYVVGVDPEWQGTGLGYALTVAGLRSMRDRDLPWALLYVDEENRPAVRLYQSLGFTLWDADVMYATR